MNILFTGAFGFVATNISKAVKNEIDAKLIAVDIAKSENKIYDEFVYWKELKSVDWQNVDVVIHLAGKAHDTKNTADEKSYFDINYELTKEIFGYFQKSGATKFIFFSSVKAVADKVEGECLVEDAVPAPKTPYGKSKLAAEQYIQNQKLPADKKVYILRPCMIHGPGNKGNLNLLYKIVKKGIPWPLGAYKNARSFCSIDNLAFVINSIIQKDITPGIYQVADDDSISTNKIIELIAKSVGKRPKIRNLKKSIIEIIARIGDKTSLPLSTERLKKLTESYVVSNRKLKQELGVKQLPISAEVGLQKTLDSFKN